MKINNYKVKEKLLLAYFICLVATVYLTLQSTSAQEFIKGEFESFQQYNRSFSSTVGLYHDGGMSPFSSLSSAETFDVVARVGALVFNGYNPPDGIKGNIELFIKFKHLNKIYKDRERAIVLGVNRDSQDVPCKISDGEKILACKVKLKGDLEDHWKQKTRLSLKVKVKGGYIHGLKQFSLQKPRARQFPYDQVFHHLAAEMGSHSSNKQEFYSVSVNGDNWGTMNIEPDIDQEFVEGLGLKRLGVFRISNQDVWSYGEKYSGLKGYYLSDPTINLSLKGPEKVIGQNAAYREIYSYVKQSLHAKNASLFNREMMIENLALSLTWGAFHTLYSSNSFYTWNVYEKQLEPILTDQVPWRYWNTLEGMFANFKELPFEYRVLLNSEPLKAGELRSALVKIKQLLKANPALDKANDLKKKYFPADRIFDKEPLSDNMRLIDDSIGPVIEYINLLAKQPLSEPSTRESVADKLPTLEAFHRVEAFDDGRIRVHNLTNLELTILAIRRSNENYLSKDRVVIPPSEAENLKFVDFKIEIKQEELTKIVVQAEINGISRYASADLVLTATTEEQRDRNIGCIFIDDQCILDSKFSSSKSIIYDRHVIIKAGSTVDIRNGANLTFLSGLTATGTSRSRIVFSGDRSGGINILNPDSAVSKLSHLNFEGLGEVREPMNRLTGAVNGYGGKFIMSEVRFDGCEAEDQLNLVHAEVEIGRAFFKGAKSDAFDCDFCIGRIRSLSFNNVAGDGLDISGSMLQVTHLESINILDKSLSVGEKSFITVQELSVDKVSTGVAVKDSSSATIRNMTAITVMDDALMTYVKKPFYSGVTTLKVNKLEIKGKITGNTCVRAKETELFVNGVACEVTDVSIETLYKGRMKK